MNDVKINKTTVLKTGDTIVMMLLSSARYSDGSLSLVITPQSLGVEIPRNGNTPTYITSEQLKPIIAKVTLTGVAS